jgi:hypothetical protein
LQPGIDQVGRRRSHLELVTDTSDRVSIPPTPVSQREDCPNVDRIKLSNQSRLLFGLIDSRFVFSQRAGSKCLGEESDLLLVASPECGLDGIPEQIPEALVLKQEPPEIFEVDLVPNCVAELVVPFLFPSVQLVAQLRDDGTHFRHEAKKGLTVGIRAI